jgi:hypothetical protein
LINDYKGENCGKESTLSLKKDGSFKLVTSSEGKPDSQAKEGKWLYRQYPFIELKINDAPYADYYFELTQYKGRDEASICHPFAGSGCGYQNYPNTAGTQQTRYHCALYAGRHEVD